MICASGSARRERILVLPWPPAPSMAMFTFSLGETKRGPPSTWRGTMVRAATPAVVAPRNLRRVNWRLDFGLFIMVRRVLAPVYSKRTPWQYSGAVAIHLVFSNQ